MPDGGGMTLEQYQQKLANQSQQPAAPEGQQQLATSGTSDATLAGYLADTGYVPEAQSWYTGANDEGTNNGWDNQFVDDFISGQEKAAQTGTLGTYFEKPNATGVVTWDHTSTDGTTDFHFGDIYQDGQKAGNIYKQFDTATADLMMADWLFDGSTKAEIFGASDNVERLRREVQAKRQQNNTDIPNMLSAQEFQGDVEQRAEGFQEGNVDEALVGGATAGGAALGAGVGAVVGGVGAVPGAIIGGAVGFLGGVLNKDSLTEQAARAYEITSMSSDENGTAAGIATGIQQWAGVAGKSIVPLSNIVQGAYDVNQGEIGDGRSEFYRLDKAGDSDTPGFVKVLDVAASVGDAGLQFASPIGVGLYTAQMGAYIGGEVGELALTGGKSFDYTSGSFDNIFTDDKGDFSPTQAMAGIGKVGIDVVQLGIARGLAGKADAAIVRTGGDTLYGRLLSPFRSAAGKQALAEGGAETTVAGFKVVTDKAGAVVSQRPSLSLLAPSEQLQALSARMIGLRQAALREPGSYSMDDFYRAALAMSTGERRIQTALVNGFGEGAEEAIQQVLDPYSHQAAISAQDIGQSALYGFAMGAGMSLGTGARTPSMDTKMYSLAAAAHYSMTGGDELKRSAWDASSDMEKRSMAALGNLQAETLKSAYEKLADDHGAEMAATVVGMTKLTDAVQSVLKQNLASSTDRTDGAFVIIPLEDAALPADAVSSSGLQLARNHVNRMRGIATQMVTLQRQQDEIVAQLAKDPTNEDLLATQGRLNGELAQIDLMLKWGQVIDQELDPRIGRLYAENASQETVVAEAAAINDLLSQAFNRQLEHIGGVPLTDEDKLALAKVVSQVTTRDPQDASHSFQVLLPQVDPTLTMWRSDNVLGISQTILPAIRGDYDGDKVRDLNQLMLDDNAFTSLRAGTQFIGAGGSVNIGTAKSEKWVLEDLSQSLRAGGALANEATQVLVAIGSQVRARYDGIIDDDVLDEVLSAFNEVVHTGEGDARAALLDGLAAKAGGQITEYARGHLSNEWTFLSRLVQQHLQNFQGIYAAHTPREGEVNTTPLAPNQQSTFVRERKMVDAATEGATLGQQTAGDSMYRKIQKLHYSLFSSTADTADTTDRRAKLAELTALYEMQGKNLTRSALDEVRGKDDITARVFLQLQRDAITERNLHPTLTTMQAMSVIANTRVLDVAIAPDGTLSSNGKEISYAQLLLKRSVQRDKREKDVILASSPELMAKHRRLEGMSSAPTQGVKGSRGVNAERAFVEVFGSQQLYSLLGEQAQIFGAHLTVEQFVRSYVSQSEVQRKEMTRQLKNEPAYLGRKEKHNIPYDVSELTAEGGITAYRSVVDSILATGNDRITIDDAGKLNGELAQKSDDVGANFRTAHRQVREALKEFAGLQPGRETGLDVHLIQRMMQANPELERKVMALIPNSAASKVLQDRGDNVYIANWVYRTFALQDAAEAEMHYYRNLLTAEWWAQGNAEAVGQVEGEDAGNARRLGDMKRRMHRVWWRLASLKDGGLLLSKFISELETATSVEEFIKWVNTTPGIRGEQAPLTAWVDDVADFDMDKADGGWTTSLQGAERREAIRSLQLGAENLVADIAQERAAVEDDTSVLQAVARHAKVKAGADGAVPKQGDRALYEQLSRVIDEAGERYEGLGPQAMVYQIVAAARGFYPQAHNKGSNPDHLDAAAAIDAQRDAFGYVTNYERVMGALTTHNIDAVSTSLELVSKDDGRTMDDYGRPVPWEKPTVDQMVDLLSNPQTRPFARAMLFPHVQERDFDGRMRPKLLVGKSLRALLSGSTHNDLFPKHDVLTQDAGFRYLAAVEAQARQHDGHFSVQRAVTDIVIARTSAADHVLSTAEIERMTIKAAMEVAKISQAVGSVPVLRDENGVTIGPDPLDELLVQVKKARRLNTAAIALGLKVSGEDAVLKDVVFDSLVQERQQQSVAVVRDLLARASTATAEEAEMLERQIAAENASATAFEQRLRLLTEDDFVASVVQMFTIPDNAVEGAAAKSNLLKYITSHLSIMERSSSNLLLLNRVTTQLLDSGRNGQVTLRDEEWRELSNAVISVYIDSVVASAAPSVSVAPFPDVDSVHAKNQRYYDLSFGYLAEPLMDPNSPLVKAARDIHARAGRFQVQAADTEIVSLLDRTLYADFSLGKWTEDVSRASIEANELLDTASAAPATPMTGNSPKRQGALSAAMRRTYDLPDEALLSRATLSWADLHKDSYDEVAVTHPTGDVMRPLLQLSNRFAKSVTMHYTDIAGQEQAVDLLAGDANLGRVFAANAVAAASGYQEIHIDRVRDAVDKAMGKLGRPVAGARVDIEFFHPDMQPAEGYHNNLFFEGINFKLDADVYDSLNAGLFFATGGINPEASAASLDSRKLGVPGLRVIGMPTFAQTKAYEEGWLVDFGAMLRAKTREIMDTDLGFGKLEPEYYNAVYKNMKMRHFVDATLDGEPVRYTAEQFMEFQRTEMPPIENPKLWIPSDDVLRSMLGELGTQGVARVLNPDFEIDLAAIPTYAGLTPRMLELFPVTDETLALADTKVANRARQMQLQVRPMLMDAERNAYDQRMQFFAEIKNLGFTDRSQIPEVGGPRGFNPQTNIDRARIAGAKMINAEAIPLNPKAGGIEYVAERNEGTRAQSLRVLDQIAAVLKATTSSTGWIYREGSEANAPQGLLSQVSLGGDTRPGLQVLPGDLVVVELDSFNRDSELAQKRIDYLAGRGAVIVLGATDGSNDLRAELADYLQSKTYAPIAGSNNAFEPTNTTLRYQNVRARASSLTEVRGVSNRSRVVVLYVPDQGIEENGGWVVDPQGERITAINKVLNLVPTNFLAGFNVPASLGQIDAVRAQLQGLNTKPGRALLNAQADGDITESFQRMLMRFDANPGTVLPVVGDEFGTGDFIPLVDNQGRVLLYRHGYKAPTRDDVDRMTAMTLPGSLDALNVAVFPDQTNPLSTDHIGTVVKVNPRSGYGLSMELDIPLQVFGDKKVLEWNGMKLLLTNKPDRIKLPAHTMFANGLGVDIIASAHDMVSKESFEDLVNNHRNAFSFFGIDFLPDVAKFFNTDPRQARELLTQVALRGPQLTLEEAQDINSAGALSRQVLMQLPEFATQFPELADATWVSRLATTDTVEAQIVRAMLVYLMTPGARVEDVLGSGSAKDDSTDIDAQSIKMPQLFTQVFDLAPFGSDLRVDINRRFNDQIDNPAGSNVGYVLHQDFTLEVRNEDPTKNLHGFLQFAEAHSSGDNPIMNGMAFDSTEKAGVSQHSADMASQAINAQTAYRYDPVRAARFIGGRTAESFSKDFVDGGLWRMITGIDANDRSAGMVWRADTPLEAERRNLSAAVVTQYRQVLSQVDEKGWTEAQRKQYQDLRLKIVRRLGLLDAQAELVDFWIRQHDGRPKNLDPTQTENDEPNGKAAIEAAQDIFANVESNYLPTLGGEVPLLHLHDLQLIRRQNETSKKWAPRESMGRDSALASSWNEWVEVSLGSAITSDNNFDPLYLLALDGMMHTYQSATRSLLDLPVSMDSLKSQQLVNPDNNRMLVSLDPNQAILASEPLLLETTRASLDELIGGQRIAGKFQGRAAPASEVAKRRAARRSWRKENDVPIPVDVSMKNFRKNGAQFVESSTTTSALIRMMINLRVGTALINPMLYLSMGPEQWVRGTLDRAANLLTGQSTAGVTAAAAAKVGASTFSVDQIKKLKLLYNTLGQRSDFKGMIYSDLNFLRPRAEGIGRVDRMLERYARFGARMQDPTWGMRADTLARRYVEAAIQHINATPTLTILSVDRLIAEMSVDPLFLQKNYLEAHQYASNAIAQLRSLKATPLSLALRGIYEPLSESSNTGVNVFGNLVLKMPLLFSAYGMNVLTTITGMQGYSDMAAAFLHGRKKGILGRAQTAMRGDPQESDELFDMSSVIEGIDLTRSFIRGGLTHTGLFALGMMAGGLGLSGEDDETKKRRKMSALQGAGFVYDPRRLENDFRNNDAIFLDWLPLGLSSLFQVTTGEDGQAMAQMPWVMRQFISPIIGMEKFFETGDFRQVQWGFADALGSFPLINTMMYSDAVSTAHELASMAKDEEKLGDPSNLSNATWFLTNAVGTYERMLFENSFVNEIYIAKDRYDRDPYVLPLRDSDGQLQKDIEGNVRPNDLAVEQYIDPETGQIMEGYQARSTSSAVLHSLTENRATLAVVSALFTGLGNSDFVRYNMPEKLRSFDLPEVNRDTAEAVILAASTGQGGGENISLEEITSILKAQYIAAENWKGYNQVDSQAAAIYKAQNGVSSPLSVIQEDDVEVLTEEGSWAVMRGLAKGTVQLGDESLAGIYIPYEMRQKIQAEWMKDLVQEGVDLGLDQTKATQRMKRLWYGPTDDPTVQGLGDLLWSEDISYSNKVTYKQLNTTYIQGPDGKPWATGFQRGNVFNLSGLAPLNKAWLSEQSATGTDDRLNTVDRINGTNTGLRALELVNDSSYIPTDKEIGDSIVKAIEDAAGSDYTPYTPYASSNGSGGYYGGGYGGGYGGSGGYASSPYFQKMYALPGGATPYANSLPVINASTPYVRRASIRRERVWSERGRLKQWQ